MSIRDLRLCWDGSMSHIVAADESLAIGLAGCHDRQATVCEKINQIN
jgi:hypothetical protein